MPAPQINTIFLGHTPVEQRKYITEVFKYLKYDYPKLIIPAVGQFTLVKCALYAGYKKEDISTSDFSLYSSLLGYLFSDKSIELLDFVISDEYKSEYDLLTNDIDRVAYLFWLMKVAQLSNIHYLKIMYEDLFENKAKHIRILKEQIEKMVDQLKGINYEIKDLRDEFVSRASNTLLVINPPVFKNGYTKMFDFGEFLQFENKIEEFDWKKEYKQLYDDSKLLEYPDYWLITKPNLLKEFRYYKNIASFSKKKLVPYKLPVFSGKDRISENSSIRFITVPPEVGLYYRDLFAHRLGNTAAEHYFLITIDNKVFSTVGFMTSKLFGIQCDYIFENFGFNVYHPEYKNANRLLMMLITSKDFSKVAYNSMSKRNRFYTLNGLHTTCISKYRDVKINQGILHRYGREVMPNGLYKIAYGCTWHKRDFKEVLKLFLDENRLGRKILTSETLKKEQNYDTRK